MKKRTPGSEKYKLKIVKISECGTTHSIIYSRLFIEQVIKLYPTDECFFQKAFTLDEKYYIFLLSNQL